MDKTRDLTVSYDTETHTEKLIFFMFFRVFRVRERSEWKICEEIKYMYVINLNM